MKTLMLATLALFGTAQAKELPALKLDLNHTTVSGLSSGGYMATQFHFAHADWVKGAAIVAAGPLYCAQNNLLTALDRCVNKAQSDIPLNDIQNQLALWATQGKIASKEALANSRVWLFYGTKDEKIHPKVASALYQQYQEFLPKTQLAFVNDKPFAHHQPTLNSGTDCALSEAPFLGNCNYDAAGEALKFMLPALTAPADKATGTLYKIAQQHLVGDNANTMAADGYVYVPKTCAQGSSCTLHISFHGCNQSAEAVGTAYAEQAGFNRYADTNQMVVLYPQARASKLMPLNPQGCWDWWGYTNADYATKQGPQIQAVHKLAKWLQG